MRVVNSTFISLDGVTEHLDKWHFAHHDASGEAYALDQFRRADAMLMGRATYDVYASAWPGRSGELAERINAMPRYVASRTLQDPTWAGTTVLQGDLIDAVRALRERPGGDLLMNGFGPVARTLVRHGLLDELHLWVHPVLAGVGEPEDRLFRDGLTATFALARTKTLDTGVVVITYRSEHR